MVYITADEAGADTRCVNRPRCQSHTGHITSRLIWIASIRKSRKLKVISMFCSPMLAEGNSPLCLWSTEAQLKKCGINSKYIVYGAKALP